MDDSKGHFGNGFLLGAIIGGGLVFLVGTKKGRKFLKTLTEEGLAGISDLGDLVEDYHDEQEDEEEYDENIIEPTPQNPEKKGPAEMSIKTPKASKAGKAVRRFFKKGSAR